jgi:hypothetical protein
MSTPDYALRIGMPEQQPTGEYGCAIECPTVLGHSPTIYGEDPAQALELAVRFIAGCIADFKQWRENSVVGVNGERRAFDRSYRA